jgi:hypothetical protein
MKQLTASLPRGIPRGLRTGTALKYNCPNNGCNTKPTASHDAMLPPKSPRKVNRKLNLCHRRGQRVGRWGGCVCPGNSTCVTDMDTSRSVGGVRVSRKLNLRNRHGHKLVGGGGALGFDGWSGATGMMVTPRVADSGLSDTVP